MSAFKVWEDTLEQQQPKKKPRHFEEITSLSFILKGKLQKCIF